MSLIHKVAVTGVGRDFASTAVSCSSGEKRRRLDEEREEPWSAGDVARTLHCLSVHDGISIAQSPICNDNGVFCIADGGIQPNEAISIYPGYYRLVKSRKNAPPLKYALSIHPVNFTPPNGDSEGWVIDATRLRYSKNDGIGHFINSSHPSMPPPYNTHNCQFIEENDYEYVEQGRPPLVFVVTSSYIPKGAELLIDYHYLLNGIYSEFSHCVLQCSCPACVV